MATTTIQHHNPIMLVQQQQQRKSKKGKEDEDIALANYLSSSLRFDQSQELWNFTHQQQYYNSNANTNFYFPQQPRPHRQQRTRVSSNSSSSSNHKLYYQHHNQHHSPQKSTSTPIISQQQKQQRSANTNNNINSVKSSGRKQQQQQPRPSSSLAKSKHHTPNALAVDTINRRRSVGNPLQPQEERRPSIASNASIRSEISVSSKLSLSKRLRKVFSLNNLRSAAPDSVHSDLASLADRNDSSSSVASSMVGSPLSTCSMTVGENREKRKTLSSFRRRSIASLSSLFQNGNKGSSSSSIPEEEDTESTDDQTIHQQKSLTPSQQQNPNSNNSSSSRRHSSGDLRQLAKEDKKREKRPTLRVDTSESSQGSSLPNVRKSALKVHSSTSCWSNNSSSIAPDSPNSVVSSRSSFTRLPPPQQQRNFIQLPEPGLPSPTPSTASSIKQGAEEEGHTKPAAVGLHYGLGLHHGSPRLKPTAAASSSNSSLVTSSAAVVERRIQFCSTIQVHETFSSGDYDRRCDTSATCQKLTPMTAMKIKQELNEYKLSEMEVHVESRQYTHFFL
ncbi:MAG: hypothetical protein EXX96DRAFT_544940 [Benjaminiella poitrasii]|nr:MAG: hypothetical protein EXX96DRAFT_544940 [Benjaminiella poitrasii]